MLRKLIRAILIVLAADLALAAVSLAMGTTWSQAGQVIGMFDLGLLVLIGVALLVRAV